MANAKDSGLDRGWAGMCGTQGNPVVGWIYGVAVGSYVGAPRVSISSWDMEVKVTHCQEGDDRCVW